MRKIWNLCLLQLEENHTKLFNMTKKQKWYLAVGIILFLIAISAIYYFVIRKVFIMLMLQDGSKELLTTILSIFFVVFTISLVVTIIKRIYYARDNTLFAALPISNRGKYISKLLCILIEETIKDVLFVFPFLVVYAIYVKMSVGAYFLIIPALVLFILLVFSTALLFSVPAFLIVNLVQKSNIATLIVSVFVIASAFLLYMYLLGSLFDGFNPVTGTLKSVQKLKDAMKFVSKIFVFVDALSSIIYLDNAFILFGVVAFFAFSFCLTIYLSKWNSKRLFNKTEHREKDYKNVFADNGAKFKGILKKDIVLLLRSPNVILSCFLFSLIMPFFMYSLNMFLYMIDLSTIGVDLVKGANILAFGVLVLLSCGYTATAISSEGGNYYLLKITPTEFRKFAHSKILINIIFVTFFVLITLILLLCFSYINFVDFILLLLISFVLSVGQSFSSLESDLNNPSLDTYDNIDIVSNSKSNVHATTLALILGIVLGVIAMLLIPIIGVTLVYICILGFSVIFTVIKIYLFRTRLNYYFRNLEV